MTILKLFLVFSSFYVIADNSVPNFKESDFTPLSTTTCLSKYKKLKFVETYYEYKKNNQLAEDSDLTYQKIEIVTNDFNGSYAEILFNVAGEGEYQDCFDEQTCVYTDSISANEFSVNDLETDKTYFSYKTDMDRTFVNLKWNNKTIKMTCENE